MSNNNEEIFKLGWVKKIMRECSISVRADATLHYLSTSEKEELTRYIKNKYGVKESDIRKRIEELHAYFENLPHERTPDYDADQ